MVALAADHDRLGHRQQPQNPGAAVAAEKAPDRAHALQPVLVLPVHDCDKPLGDIVQIADERDALHQRIDQIAHPALETAIRRRDPSR